MKLRQTIERVTDTGYQTQHSLEYDHGWKWMQVLEEPKKLNAIMADVQAILKEPFWEQTMSSENIAALRKSNAWSEKEVSDQVNTKGMILQASLTSANEIIAELRALKKAKVTKKG